jgi:hypothetical protein
MTQYLENPDPLLDEVVGFYPAFQRTLELKIADLIRIRFKNGDLDFGAIQCHRPQCEHITIFMKSQRKHIIRCSKCNISEFCSLCSDIDHGRTPCNLTRDQASEALIAEISKKCPTCLSSIMKDGGCNHMHCKRCQTDFCWLCGMTYTLDQMNAHYTIGRNVPNSSGQCVGLQLPPRPRVDAFMELPPAQPARQVADLQFGARVDAMVDAFMELPPARPAHPAQPARQVADFMPVPQDEEIQEHLAFLDFLNMFDDVFEGVDPDIFDD